MWANIQKYDHPNQLLFELSNNKCWTTLLPGGMDQLLSVQQDLIYTQTDGHKVKELQERYFVCVVDPIWLSEDINNSKSLIRE